MSIKREVFRWSLYQVLSSTRPFSIAARMRIKY